MKLKAALLVASLAFAGCATTPEPAIQTNLPPPPTSWHHAPREGAALIWPGAGDATLDALLALSESRNRDLVQAGLRLKLADLQAAQGRLRLTPTASANMGLTKPLDSIVPAGGSGLDLVVSWEADLWGRLAALRASDAAQQRAFDSDVRAARLSLHNRVATLYWQAAAARQQEALAHQQRAIARELLGAARVRVREGKLLPIEIDRAAASLQAAEVRLADLQADGAAQRLQLALLLDQPPPGPPLEDAKLPADMPSAALPNDAPATVLERRPDVQRARAQVDTALALLHAREAARYPALSFSAGVSGSSENLRDALQNPLVSLAANLVVPMIDWRRLDLQRETARTELELAALQLRETVETALAEIETAWIDEARLRQQASANGTRLREAREAERVAALRVEVGQLARTELLQAQIATLEAKQVDVQLRLRAWLQRARLMRAWVL